MPPMSSQGPIQNNVCLPPTNLTPTGSTSSSTILNPVGGNGNTGGTGNNTGGGSGSGGSVGGSAPIEPLPQPSASQTYYNTTEPQLTTDTQLATTSHGNYCENNFCLVCS